MLNYMENTVRFFGGAPGRTLVKYASDHIHMHRTDFPENEPFVPNFDCIDDGDLIDSIKSPSKHRKFTTWIKTSDEQIVLQKGFEMCEFAQEMIDECVKQGTLDSKQGCYYQELVMQFAAQIDANPTQETLDEIDNFITSFNIY